MEKELYIYEEQHRDYGRRNYTVKRKAKEVICWDCGYKWLIRKDRKTPQYCRTCAFKGEKNPRFGKEDSKKGNGSFDRKEYNRNYNNQQRWEKKKKLIKTLGNKCWKCGEENLPICVWQWHHLIPQEKEISISQILTHSWTTILKESQKCVLVCSNCHKCIHYGEERINAI